MGKVRSCCTLGNFLQARPLLRPFVLELLGVQAGSREEAQAFKRSFHDLLRALMKRGPEIGMMHLYVESHIQAITASGYGNHFQRRVHELTGTGLLLRPERSYLETRHGARPEEAGREAAAAAELRAAAERANMASARVSVRSRVAAAVEVARGELGVLEGYLEEVGPATVPK